jgi:outer membrane protein assembly factor BamB
MRLLGRFVSVVALGIIVCFSWLTPIAEVTGATALGITPWPMFRHDLQHTGRSPYLGAQTFHLKWSFSTGGEGIDSTPAIDTSGNLYVQSRSGFLYALGSNGILKWKFQTFDSFVGCCIGLESSPAIDSNGVVYVGSSDSNLYAIFSNGTLDWRFTTRGPIQSSPTIGNDGTIYVGSNDGNLYAITQNGQLKWKFATAGAVVSSPAIDYIADSSSLRAIIYFGSNDARLYAISQSGELAWSFKTGGGVVSSPTIGRGGIAYVASRDGYVYAINRGGNLVWKFLIAPECTDFPVNCANDSSPAISSRGTIYIGEGAGGDGEGFYAIDRNGTLLWKSPSAEIRSSPAIGSDGTVYVGMDDPVLAFNPDGTVKWVSNFTTIGPAFIFYSSPSIGPDGTIYIGTEYEGTLLAIS